MHNSRKKIVAGNWKMNKNVQEATELFNQLKTINSFMVEVIVAPPFLYLESFSKQKSTLKIAAQNCAAYPSGAYTGEVSASMLASVSVSYCIVGHSERRALFTETDEMIQLKIKELLSAKITPIFCCGEQFEDRENGNQNEIIKNQIENALFHFTENEMEKIVIAYEPVWAIGTGKTASPDQAQEMHSYIRSLISKQFSAKCADNTSILYGGSCNESNALELFSKEDIDGGLIGGASLKFDTFNAIINALE